jgi:transketolase C-terminal domain/subunit
MVYPTGFGTGAEGEADLAAFGARYGIREEVAAFAQANGVTLDAKVWIPGSLMSFRDVGPMLECLFLVNGLPGGAGHHDGHMKGRDAAEVLSNPMFQPSAAQAGALSALRAKPARRVATDARPAPGSPNLVLSDEAIAEVSLPDAGEAASARAGSEAGYAAVAKAFPERVFVVSCDLDASTKLAKARSYLSEHHQFEMGIEEQASALMANGLATSSREPQLNVFSTFAAFFEGIAREGFDMWQYQRNLTGVNEGLNVVYHLSHVGACTGRDHFSGWGLDWVNVGLNYLPYLHRFYAPADARGAFLAVKDLAAHYGGHLIGVPRDNLPVLSKQDGSGPLWEPSEPWTPVTTLRTREGARHAILAFGAPAFLAASAADAAAADGRPTDVHVVNGLPVPAGQLQDLLSRYEGVVTVEDGKIGTPETGLKGFANLIAGAAMPKGIACGHVGITDPRVAPSEGHMETWAHFGITQEGIASAVSEL